MESPDPLQWPVINYAILSPYDIFIAHLYLIQGQDGGADGDIVLMAIYYESNVIYPCYCLAMRPIILLIFYLIHAINIKVFCSQNDVS